MDCVILFSIFLLLPKSAQKKFTIQYVTAKHLKVHLQLAVFGSKGLWIYKN